MRSAPVAVGDLLGDALARSIELRDEPLTVGDWLVREFTHAFQARYGLPTAGVQSAERDLSGLFGVAPSGELGMPALTQRVREGLAEETDGLNEREERQRLAQRLIRPYSDFSDEMLRPLGDLIDDFVDDPISRVVGEAVGLANGLYEAIIALSGGSVSAPGVGCCLTPPASRGVCLAFKVRDSMRATSHSSRRSSSVNTKGRPTTHSLIECTTCSNLRGHSMSQWRAL